MMKVLWLSRHAMTSEQQQLFGHREVVALNATFPASAFGAVQEILRLAEEHGASAVAGVFPAHVAAAYAIQRKESGWSDPTMYIPVSVPSPAVEGEVRGGGFVFSHWEVF